MVQPGIVYNAYKVILQKGYTSYIAAICVMVILPLHPQYLPPFMILWVLAWIFENLNKFSQTLQSPADIRMLFFTFLAYYLFQLISLTYTVDLQMGLSNAFGRLSLVIFPMVLFYPGEIIRDKSVNLLKIFSLSTFCFLLVCFLYAGYRSLSLSDGTIIFNPHPIDYPYLSYFYGSELTIAQHPSYLSMYVLISAFISFEMSFSIQDNLKKAFWFIIAFFLIISLYFISSRTGILVTILLLPFYFFRKIRKLNKSKFLFITILVLTISSLPLLLNNQRVDYLYDKIMNNETNGSEIEEPRFIIWKAATAVLKDNPLLGTGIGDVRMELVNEFTKEGRTDFAESRPNAHNQFIEVLLESGIIGFILFVTVIIIMFRIALQNGNLLYGVFIIVILAFFTFETVLYRLAGVSFFPLFSFLLYWYEQKEKAI